MKRPFVNREKKLSTLNRRTSEFVERLLAS